jgi:3-hydroxyacyl-[acyl-carrier-protein] dehydratase
MTNTSTLLVPAQHPAFHGHFPGAPLLPGVVLLDEMLHSLGDAGAGEWLVSSAKFLHPVRPGETLTLEHNVLASGSIRFVIRIAMEHAGASHAGATGRPGADGDSRGGAGALVATGTLVPRRANTEPDHGHQAG